MPATYAAPFQELAVMRLRAVAGVTASPASFADVTAPSAIFPVVTFPAAIAGLP